MQLNDTLDSRFFRLISLGASFAIALSLASCGLTSKDLSDESPNSSKNELLQDIVPDIAVTPQIPEVPNGFESIVTITGNFGGESINLTWDFKKPTPSRKCNGQDTVLTNGALATLASSNYPAIEIRMEGDWGSNNCAMTTSDWFVRFTVGNLNSTTTYANGKREFAIPNQAYTMITIHKGSDDTNARRNYENDNTNTALTAKIEDVTYDENLKTLRLKGSAKGAWQSGDIIEINFNILVNGSDDRNLNSSTLQYAFEQGAFGGTN